MNVSNNSLILVNAWAMLSIYIVAFNGNTFQAVVCLLAAGLHGFAMYKELKELKKHDEHISQFIKDKIEEIEKMRTTNEKPN
jgi:hypothetical protein